MKILPRFEWFQFLSTSIFELIDNTSHENTTIYVIKLRACEIPQSVIKTVTTFFRGALILGTGENSYHIPQAKTRIVKI